MTTSKPRRVRQHASVTTDHSGSRLPQLVGVAGLVVLGIAGMVLATSWVVPFPPSVFLGACAVALVAMTVVLVSAWVKSRREGMTIFRSLLESVRALGRFIHAFF